ncbi:MAG: GAF domain-containing protein [candidate division Zixibacteria bacterium]
MPQLYYDMLYFATFVIVFWAIVRAGGGAFKATPGAFSKIVMGLSFLTGFSIIQLLGNQGLMSGLPFMNDPLIRQMIEAALIVIGLITLLTGVGTWLPSWTRSKTPRSKYQKRYYCLKMINQILTKKLDFDTAMDQITSFLSVYLEIPKCAAFKYSNRNETLYLASACGFESRKPEVFREITLSQTELKNTLYKSRVIINVGNHPVFSHGREPSILIPIHNQGQIYGAILCWMGDKPKIDDDFMDFLSSISEVTGTFTANLIKTTGVKIMRKHQKTNQEIASLCNQVSSAQQLMHPFYRTLKKNLGVEYMSLADLDNSGENMMRYTIGASGRMLLEKGVSLSTKGTEIEAIFKNCAPILSPQVTPEMKLAGDDGLFISSRMESKLACPIKSGNKVLAVMVLGNSHPGYFKQMHLNQVMNLTDLISPVLQRERLSRKLETLDDQVVRLQLMERKLQGEVDIDEFFENACELLTKRMKCTMARISLVDEDKKTLISHAHRTVRETGISLNDKSIIPLSLLPWHKMAIDAEKPMMINQEDAESRMQPQESTQTLMPNIKSAMLVPITLNNKVRGIISIGEVRNWNRRSFNTGDMLIVRDVAAKCSTALKINKLESGPKHSIMEPVFEESYASANREFLTKIKSPITSIMGAVELLQNHTDTEDEKAIRYQIMIMKSADRLKELTDWDAVSSFVHDSEEIEPEQVIG